jgi:arylformamidase
MLLRRVIEHVISQNWMVLFLSCLVVGCTREQSPANSVPMPREIIDLGAVITEDLPERVWGRAFMRQMGFDHGNSFEVINWTFAEGAVSGSNAYYTLFNHGGPHVDAPNHIGVGSGIDGYPLEAFAGPLKVIDVSDFPKGRSVTVEAVNSLNIEAGDIVVIYTAYQLPETEQGVPEVITLTNEAAEYMAALPVRAFGTDSLSVYSPTDQRPVNAGSPLIEALPVHQAFLSRGIPVYEQLFNVEQLLGKENLYFVGPPLNIKNGDGMMVRPFVFVY